MLVRIFDNSILRLTLIIGVVMGTLLCIFPPDLLLFKWGANYSFQIMVFYLVLGMFFLMIGQPRLMGVTFGCAAALALFLKFSSDNTLGVKKSPQLKSLVVAHVNVANSNVGVFQTIEDIKKTKADLISIQEIDPSWELELTSCLSEEYPYFFSLPDIGIFGAAIFSKKPFLFVDTFHYKEIPNLIAEVNFEGLNLTMLSAHTIPALDNMSARRLQEHLDVLQSRIASINTPLLVAGDFHAVSWSREIRDFKNNTGLGDSRKGFQPTFPHGGLTFFEVPIDHIFYSRCFKCIDFQTLSGTWSNHLGILATFQILPEKQGDGHKIPQ
jgi:endonuclease/exonuclease/phosphatase (EEP) superfamily protein YafD